MRWLFYKEKTLRKIEGQQAREAGGRIRTYIAQVGRFRMKPLHMLVSELHQQAIKN